MLDLVVYLCSVSVKPRGCNLFSFSLRYCLVTMCCYCRSLNDAKKERTERPGTSADYCTSFICS